jgi:alpha-beta hydrolase superfamily lysophospholipase
MSASTFDTHLPAPNGPRPSTSGGFSTGRLDALVPHLIRGQLLRPGFVRMSLKLGAARQMPSWAKLQFMNAGVAPADLERVLGRIMSVETWADAWEELAVEHETAAQAARERGETELSTRHALQASAAYNFSQYVIFMDMNRKRALHEACVRSYAAAAGDFDPPSQPIEILYRRRPMCGYLRVPPVRAVPAPVVVMFNGTNAVKEELHWWSNAFLERGIATLVFDGPGMGRTFHRLSMVAEPRPVGVAILNFIETRPELDPGAVAFVGLSLGGYCTLRMAAHDKRIRAVAAVSPPFSADVYWQVTLAGMRRELAGLYGIAEAEMEASIDRITLAGDLPGLSCPMFVAGGGQDHITPATESWRIFDNARCDREIVFYPRGAHDCFNVMSDLRPRIVSWVGRKLEPYRMTTPPPSRNGHHEPAFAPDAVDPEIADALCGETPPRVWHNPVQPGVPVRWEWPWYRPAPAPIEVVHRTADAGCVAPTR